VRGGNLNTIFILMARYDARPFIPIDVILEDFFCGMSKKVFLHKIDSGEIRLPLTRLDGGQKAIKGVSVQHLAEYLDACSLAASKELTLKRTIRPNYSHTPTEELPDGS
jgi:hypothetical protein